MCVVFKNKCMNGLISKNNVTSFYYSFFHYFICFLFQMLSFHTKSIIYLFIFFTYFDDIFYDWNNANVSGFYVGLILAPSCVIVLSSYVSRT